LQNEMRSPELILAAHAARQQLSTWWEGYGKAGSLSKYCSAYRSWRINGVQVVLKPL
jgi:hypothetical protein